MADPENCRKIIDLVNGADHLFIEAAFLDREEQTARKKHHLTARQAGELARQAGVADLNLFHFSPRYEKDPQALYDELKAACLCTVLPGSMVVFEEQH